MNLLLVDGHNLAWRVHHMAAATDKNFAQYTPEDATEVVYGCLNVLAPIVHPHKNILGRHNVVVALDSGRNWRQSIDPTYKDGRSGYCNPAHRFGAQLARLPGQLAQFGIRTVAINGLEADDVIAMLAQRADLKGRTKVLMSVDKDVVSFVKDDVYYFHPSTKKLVTPKSFGAYSQELFKLPGQLTQQNWPVFRALVGDPSDKLAGVTGFKETYAFRAIQAMEAAGAKFHGFDENPDSVVATVKQFGVLPKPMPDLTTPPNLAALRHMFSLVQINQAPESLRQAVTQLDVSQLPVPPYADIKKSLETLGFQHFVAKGPAWADGFSKEGLPSPVQEM